MNKYSSYTLRDFVFDPDFTDWVKYPTTEKDTFWSGVQETYPHQNVKIQKAVEVVKTFSSFSPTVDKHIIDASREAITTSIKKFEEERIQEKQTRRFWMAAAAVLFLIGAIGGYQTLWNQEGTSFLSSNANNEAIVLENITQEISTHHLPDSSIIELYPNSKVNYKFHKYRAVSLEGKAFFSVRRNADKPFVVYTSGVTTRVLGTQFLVDAYDQAAVVKVAVTSGKVQVYPSDVSPEMANEKSVVLTSNQEASYEKEAKILKKGIVAIPQILQNMVEEDSDIKIVDMPLSELFLQLEKMYGIEFVYDHAKFSNCRVNLSLSDEPLFETLELVGKLIDGHYNTHNGQVTFVGSGCK